MKMVGSLKGMAASSHIYRTIFVLNSEIVDRLDHLHNLSLLSLFVTGTKFYGVVSGACQS